MTLAITLAEMGPKYSILYRLMYMYNYTVFAGVQVPVTAPILAARLRLILQISLTCTSYHYTNLRFVRLSVM